MKLWIPIIIVSLIISITVASSVDAQGNYSIPAWVKGVAGFWVEDKISDQEFGEGLSFLIDQGIIEVPKILELENKIAQLEAEIAFLKNQDGGTQPLPTITVSTDKITYDHSSTIFVNGKVTNPTSGTPVSLTVISPTNLIVTLDQLSVDIYGNFNTLLSTGGNLWADDGTYTIRVQYGSQYVSNKALVELVGGTTQSPEDCGPNQVFQLGQCQDIVDDSSNLAFTVETNRYSYEDGDSIIISGNVGTISTSYPDQPISIIVIGPDGNIVAILQTYPSSNGSFSHTFLAGGTMQDSGVYEVSAKYGSQSASTTFSFTASAFTPPPPPDRLNIGEVHWVEASYQSSGSGVVRVTDPDMNLDPEAVDNFDVNVWSDSDAGGIDLTVSETNVATGIFEGTVFFTTTYESSGHRLKVSEGDTITAEYRDNTLPDPYTSSDELDITGTTIIRDSSSPPNVSLTNPRIVDAFGNTSHSVSVDQQIQITADIDNQNNFEQIFVYYFKVRETGHEAWISGTLSAGQSFSPALSWTPDAPGTYTIDITIFEDIERQNVLAPTLTIQVIVG